MISKSKLKELSVYKQQKRCEEDSVFIVEGVKMCHEAMAAKAPVKVVCATNSWLSQVKHCHHTRSNFVEVLTKTKFQNGIINNIVTFCHTDLFAEISD